MAEGKDKEVVDEGESECSLEYVSPGARFFPQITRAAVVKIEMEEPFEGMEIYKINDVDIRLFHVADIPPEAFPYPNCLFVSNLSL